MDSKKDARDSLVRELKARRDDHRKMSEKIARFREKLMKRSRKLLALESEIAKLERRVFPATTARRKRIPARGKSLRTAVLIYNPESGGNASHVHRLKTIVQRLAAHGIRAKVGEETS